jgi:hypothetical protein
MEFKLNDNQIQGKNVIASGNVSVSMYQDAGKWRFRVSVFGDRDPDHDMRAGFSAIMLPEEFSGARALKEGVGRMAAFLAKRLEKSEKSRYGKHRPCVDETDAYKGAVELLEECLIVARNKGLA